MYRIQRFVLGRWKVNCYVLHDDKNAVLIDAGSGTRPIIDFIRHSSLSLKAILISHAHFDHVEGVNELKDIFHSPLYMHLEDKKLLGRMNLFRALFDKEKPVHIPTIDFDLTSVSEVTFDDLSLEVLPIPGHTPGGVCFRYGNSLFTGDTLMKGTIGRADLPGGNQELLKQSLEKLLLFPGEITVYPGHGDIFPLKEAQQGKFKLAL